VPDLPEKVWNAEDFAQAANVSRETLARLKAYIHLLSDWNNHHNLVSAASLKDVWRRHVWDCAQLAPLVPDEARSLADLGSGAGLPGLVLAALLRDRVSVTLFEATAKKCTFLEAAAARMQISVQICNQRMEDATSQVFDVVTARACAPLPKLLGYAQKFLGPNSVCLLLKGQNVAVELTEAHKCWSMETKLIPSKTAPSGAILEVRNLVPHGSSNAPSARQAPRAGRRQSKRRGR
jgi:16S rRNA (guanine527-N7)-methyltransferase